MNLTILSSLRPRIYQAPSMTGVAILSGSFPLSMITQGGNLPNQAQVRVLYRPNQGEPGDGIVAATTTCNADGTWQVSGLNENLKFDIVARIPGFNDVIISDVQPTGAPLSAHFANLKEEYEYGQEVNIQVVAMGGRPPYEYQVVTLPEGLSINPVTGYITGTIGNSSELNFEFLISDSEGTQIPLTGASYVNGDPHWDKVVALLHFDGDDNGTTFTDETGRVWTAIGDAKTKASPKKWGTAAGDFNGVNSYISTPHSSNLNVGSANYTVEAWVYLRAAIPYVIFASKGNSTAIQLPVLLSMDGSGTKAQFGVGIGHAWKVAVSNIALPLNEWVHIAGVRSGGSLLLFQQGVLVGTATAAGPAMDNTSPLTIGANAPGNGFANVVVDDFRLTISVARYTENFTPPTEPFPNF